MATVVNCIAQVLSAQNLEALCAGPRITGPCRGEGQHGTVPSWLLLANAIPIPTLWKGDAVVVIVGEASVLTTATLTYVSS